MAAEIPIGFVDMGITDGWLGGGVVLAGVVLTCCVVVAVAPVLLRSGVVWVPWCSPSDPSSGNSSLSSSDVWSIIASCSSSFRLLLLLILESDIPKVPRTRWRGRSPSSSSSSSFAYRGLRFRVRWLENAIFVNPQCLRRWGY